MGRELRALLQGGYAGGEIAALVDTRGGEDISTDFSQVTAPADLVTDFSFHTATAAAVDYALAHRLPLVVGTTGHTEEERARILAAAREIPVFYTGNMSLGIAVLCRLVKDALRFFPTADVEILEIHHNRKADAPSGTALMLADAVKSQRPDAEYVYGRSGQHKRQPNEIGIHSLRMGNVVGEHEVIFATDNQTITLKHQAHDRALFAEGALTAAGFLVGQPAGFYHMDDLLGP